MGLLRHFVYILIHSLSTWLMFYESSWYHCQRKAIKCSLLSREFLLKWSLENTYLHLKPYAVVCFHETHDNGQNVDEFHKITLPKTSDFSGVGISSWTIFKRFIFRIILNMKVMYYFVYTFLKLTLSHYYYPVIFILKFNAEINGFNAHKWRFY